MLKCDPLETDEEGNLSAEINGIFSEENSLSSAVPGEKVEVKRNESLQLNKSTEKIVCFLCMETFRTFTDREMHLLTHENEIPYECPDCANLFEDLNDFVHHMNDHDSTKEANSIDHKLIDISQKSLNSFDEFENSMDENNAEFDELHTAQDDNIQSITTTVTHSYQCKHCDETVSLASSLVSHERRLHKQRQAKQRTKLLFECDHCHLTFTLKRNLKAHMKMHTDPPSICKYCGKSFRINSSLKQHLKKHEGVIVMHHCPDCLIPFTAEKDFENHLKWHHSIGQPSHECQVCHKAFKKACDLQKHRRIHTGDRPYKCNQCAKTFTHATSLRNHRAGIHSSDRPFQCSFCGKKFAFLGNLKVHTRSHTNERPYHCDMCDKSFARNANLLEHMRIHSGIKAYKCDECSKAFANSSTYFKHRKIHTNERNHKCHLCDKAFIQNAHLAKHIRTHTNEKPFQCELCTRSFRRSETLSKHSISHQQNDNTMRKGIDNELAHENRNIPNAIINAGDYNVNDVITVTATIPTAHTCSDHSHPTEVAHIVYTFPAPEISALSVQSVTATNNVSVHHSTDADEAANMIDNYNNFELYPS